MKVPLNFGQVSCVCTRKFSLYLGMFLVCMYKGYSESNFCFYYRQLM
jgi:hypothetical protein